MNKVFKFLKSKDFWFWMVAILVMILLVVIYRDCTFAMAAVIPGVSGGKILTGCLLYTSDAADDRKIRPMSTPIDQLSRWTGARRSGSMIVDYYSVDVKPTKATLNVAYTEPTSSDVTAASQKVKLNTTNNDIFEVPRRFSFKELKGMKQTV